MVAYRLGRDGLLPAKPFSAISLVNPRRLLLAGDVLYVALDDRLVSLSLGSDGSLPSQPTAETRPRRGADYRDLVLVGNVLYAAAPGLLRIQAFALDQGHLPAEELSASGTALSDYISLASANGFVYAGSPGAARVDTYLIQTDGSLPDFPEDQIPETTVDFPQQLLLRGATLFVIELGDQRISAFRIRTNGLPAHEADSRTPSFERYARILIDGQRLYASAFNKGRIDVYAFDPVTDSIPEQPPLASTRADPGSFPSGMLIDGGVLYVAQAGLDRIDAYILGSDGIPTEFPSSSTEPIAGAFPTDLALGVFATN